MKIRIEQTRFSKAVKEVGIIMTEDAIKDQEVGWCLERSLENGSLQKHDLDLLISLSQQIVFAFVERKISNDKSEKTYPTIVRLAKKANERFGEQWWLSNSECWLRLDFHEKVAVFVRNLSDQVCSGGFQQWHDNGHSVCGPELIKILRLIGCDRVASFVEAALEYLVGKYKTVTGLGRLELLDDCFFDHREKMLDDVEEFLLKEVKSL